MSGVNQWLERAASWRFASLLFQEPHQERTGELIALADLVPEPLRATAAALARAGAERGGHYYRVLGPGGCPAMESTYDRAAIANRGPLIADVSAFYAAFAYPPRLTSELTPDHIAVELDFLGFLALKTAFAVHDGAATETEVAERAYHEFLAEHPGFWIPELQERLRAAGDAAYADAAAWVVALMHRGRAGLATVDT